MSPMEEMFGEKGWTDEELRREHEAYRRWLAEEYGHFQMAYSPTYLDTFRDEPSYRRWVVEGRPGYVPQPWELRGLRTRGRLSEFFPVTPITGETGPIAQLPEVTQPSPTPPDAGGHELAIGEPEISVINGFYVAIERDTDGNVLSFKVLGRAGMDEYETATLQSQQAQFAFQQQKLEQERRDAIIGAQLARATQRQIAGAQMSERDIQRQIDEARAEGFESFRQQVLSGVAPRGYFMREFMRTEPNPFAIEPETTYDTVRNLEQELATQEGSLSTVRERVTQNLDLAGSGIAQPPSGAIVGLIPELVEREARVDRLQEKLAEAEAKHAEFRASGQQVHSDRRIRQPIVIPEELQEFFPRGIGGEFVTPSAQALNRLSFRDRERLMGGIEFRGEQPAGVLEDIGMMTSQRRRGPRTAPISL